VVLIDARRFASRVNVARGWPGAGVPPDMASLTRTRVSRKTRVITLGSDHTGSVAMSR